MNSPDSPDPQDSLQDLKQRMRHFAAERDWDQFHSPKNLAMALAGESGELLECFQWLTEEQSRQLSGDKRQAAVEEVADVFLYTIRLADKMGIDLYQAALAKMQKNGERYPAEQVRGSSRKYNEY